MKNASVTKIQNDCFVYSATGHNIATTKLCRGCNRELALDKFSRKKTEGNRLESRCKECKSKQASLNRKKRLDRIKMKKIPTKRRGGKKGFIEFSKTIELSIDMDANDQFCTRRFEQAIGGLVWLEERREELHTTE